MDGEAGYSQGFFTRDFAGLIAAEGNLRITVENAGGGQVGQILQRFDQFQRDLYFDYLTKPPLDGGPLGGPVVLEVPVTLGSTYNVRVEMWDWTLLNAEGAIAIAGDGYSLPAGMHTIVGNFYNTATLGGVTVLDNAGTEIAATVMGSELNYANPFTAPPPQELPPLAPVPEPATATLIMAMFIALSCRRLRIS
jgi:hypothetical protein